MLGCGFVGGVCWIGCIGVMGDAHGFGGESAVEKGELCDAGIAPMDQVERFFGSSLPAFA